MVSGLFMVFFSSSQLGALPVGCQIGDELWVETLFIEWSDLFCLHPIHLFSLSWQFSLGTGFNIGQNAICIYISFFIRPGPLCPQKTLGIWRKPVAANLKKERKTVLALVLFIYFSLSYYPAFLSLFINIYHFHNQTLFVSLPLLELPLAFFSKATLIVSLTLLHFASHTATCSIEIRWNE